MEELIATLTNDLNSYTRYSGEMLPQGFRANSPDIRQALHILKRGQTMFANEFDQFQSGTFLDCREFKHGQREGHQRGDTLRQG